MPGAGEAVGRTPPASASRSALPVPPLHREWAYILRGVKFQSQGTREDTMHGHNRCYPRSHLESAVCVVLSHNLGALFDHSVA